MENKFDILHTFVYEFEFQCQFAVATMFVPSARINGEFLVDIFSMEKKRLPSVFITVIPGEKTSHFIMSCLKIDYQEIKAYFDDVETLNEEELKRFLNWTLPTYSENIILSPSLWNSWRAFAKREFEMKISGQFGDFGKVLRHENPFESMNELFSAYCTQYGIVNLKRNTKYDLFLLKEGKDI